ncbi:MAG: lysophospholipid acyltransferase family protein [Hyphomonadaceae bacterium]
MSKRRSQSPVIPWVGGTLIWAYMSILSHTMRWRVEGMDHVRKLWDSPQGWVAATWHSRILLMPYIQIRERPKWPKPPHPATLMVSPSKDGEFTKRAGTWLGLHIIRGSSSGRSDKSKRGVSAARESMEVMKKGGCIVMTIDGPKGPREVVGIGTIKLAQQMGVPIVIYGLSAHAKRLDTWDRLLWPKPFARGAVVIAEPIPTSKSMDSEELRQRVEVALKAATKRADELCGLECDTVPLPEPKKAEATATDDPVPIAANDAGPVMEHRGT